MRHLHWLSEHDAYWKPLGVELPELHERHADTQEKLAEFKQQVTSLEDSAQQLANTMTRQKKLQEEMRDAERFRSQRVKRVRDLEAKVASHAESLGVPPAVERISSQEVQSLRAEIVGDEQGPEALDSTPALMALNRALSRELEQARLKALGPETLAIVERNGRSEPAERFELSVTQLHEGLIERRTEISSRQPAEEATKVRAAQAERRAAGRSQGPTSSLDSEEQPPLRHRSRRR